MTRPQRVYRLEIVYPEGSREPGWRPAAWDDPRFLATLTRRQRREHLARPFRWPCERLFLSSSGAYGRALLLQAYGAEVRVRPSDPVTWPDHWDRDSSGPDSWESAATWTPDLTATP